MKPAARRVGFPLSRTASQRYGVSAAELSPASLRALALKIGAVDQHSGEERILSAGELDGTLALTGLLAEVLDRLLPADAPLLARLEDELGADGVEALLLAFRREFAVDELPGEGEAERAELVRLLLMVFWLNHNPATAVARRLFDDRALARKAPYRRAIELLAGGPVTGTRAAEDLLEARTDAEDVASDSERSVRHHLDAPIEASPRSLEGQLQAAVASWSDGRPGEQVLRALDLLAEERPRVAHDAGAELDAADGDDNDDVPEAVDLGGWAGPAPGGGWQTPDWQQQARVLSSGRTTELGGETDWKPELVLQSKQAHVWLAQISRRRGETIDRLDRIPVEELETLVGDGVTALWLIGVWERSAASRRIKRHSGARSAAASAYSIRSYTVAADLGGDPAMEELIERAGSCGLRIGADVVPNHVGLDSTWVIEHPERLLSVEQCPFPGYDFDTPDLSSDPEIGLFLERGYYDRSDAAVVFRRLERRTGSESFVYHGNDGTGLPWNDTAQLDYLNPDTRRAMLDLILEQARRFPVLRFDAAMTLTRLHYQRLWYPKPGDGGAIPSRSLHGMSTERFTELMPDEFWCQVVEQVEGAELDTLLIAEAFWLMEPYFVRDLGMHRVYNSSFMHLLRRRHTGKFRRLLEHTVASDPGMVARSVFYATNPDERPASAQFGTGDRYFGVMTLLAVLPATPLLGHGQIEGLREKYGMEYLEPTMDEPINEGMRAHHRATVVPLLVRRAEWLPDELVVLRLVDDGGHPIDDVLAVLRGSGKRAVLVVFNNSQQAVRGHLVSGPDFSGLVELRQLVKTGIEPQELELLEKRVIEDAEVRWHEWAARTPAEGRGEHLLRTLFERSEPDQGTEGLELNEGDSEGLDPPGSGTEEIGPKEVEPEEAEPEETEQQAEVETASTAPAVKRGLLLDEASPVEAVRWQAGGTEQRRSAEEVRQRGLAVEIGAEQTLIGTDFRLATERSGRRKG